MDGDGDHKGAKKKRAVFLSRDVVMLRQLHRTQSRKASPMVLLKDIFEETQDKDRFVGDTMFWKYFEDINTSRIYHTNSVEYRNLKVMCFETVFYIILLAAVSIYAYQLQSKDVFEARIEQLNYWQGCDTEGNCRIQSVEDLGSYWKWMQGELVPLGFTNDLGAPKVANIATVFPNSGFDLAQSPRYIGTQRSNILLGTMRMRQVRVQKNVGCTVSKLFSHVYPECYATFSPERESKVAFETRFSPTYLRSAFEWKDEETTMQLGVAGKHANYAGAGFMVDLPVNSSHASDMLYDLYKWNWVDRLSRAVVLEITTLNINVNVIANTNIIFEFSPNGAVTATVKTNAMRIFLFTPSLQSGAALLSFLNLIALFVIFAIHTVWVGWLMYKTCFNYLGQSPGAYIKTASIWTRVILPLRILYQFFRYGWNIADLMILCCFYAHMGFRISTYISITSEPNLAPDVIGHPEVFMPIAKMVQNLSYGNNVLSILAITCWVKLFKYLCMSSYFRLLVRILEKCAARLLIFCWMLMFVFFGFAVAFRVGLGNIDQNFSSIQKSFLVLFFLLIDGYEVDEQWFEPGKEQLVPLVFVFYIALMYFVLLNIFIAIVLDTYSLAARQNAVDASKKNPMIVFVRTYYHWMKGHSLVEDESEEHMKSEDLSISLELLPGLVRRKWVEKKREMQLVANQNFAGMILFADEDKRTDKSLSDWALPSSQKDIMENMTNPKAPKPVSLYDIPAVVLKQDVSRAQLQRLMDDDQTIPLLLGSQKAVDVIRKFKQPPLELQDGKLVNSVKAMQGSVFGRIDKLERVKVDEDIPHVPEILQITEEMSGAITDVRNQFRVNLTGIIEATAVLFEHLVEVTQGLDEVRQNNEGILEMVRANQADQDRG